MAQRGQPPVNALPCCIVGGSRYSEPANIVYSEIEH